MKKKAHLIIKEEREKYGYVHADIAPWINKKRPTYTKKENGLIPFTADEFLLILSELRRRGHKKENEIQKSIIDRYTIE